MTESEFKSNAAGGKTLAELSSYPDSEYWAGYQRGIRRNYHGDKFGTTDEHALWLSLADETGDDTRRFRGIGYRVGFDGMPISEAIKHLQQVVAKSIAGAALGSRTSEKKAAAARANGAKGGRPRMQVIRTFNTALGGYEYRATGNEKVVNLQEKSSGSSKWRTMRTVSRETWTDTEMKDLTISQFARECNE